MGRKKIIKRKKKNRKMEKMEKRKKENRKIEKNEKRKKKKKDRKNKKARKKNNEKEIIKKVKEKRLKLAKNRSKVCLVINIFVRGSPSLCQQTVADFNIEYLTQQPKSEELEEEIAKPICMLLLSLNEASKTFPFILFTDDALCSFMFVYIL
ncbi:hypothetical protein RFI_27532 [Reticulomyxa filosa]|uniref:Uncharacterized protein n=1 Tax=Reticulomyxa filosa TaxID=46433 RepID=X6MA15_RETFI|nr:hypothetical protein RFI_27532 [Reticulomyxa filosa]|eukprot:ETO09845.1 hypothetical protein RFI_27532 [Reticulomyxa filosa]